eukprot:sb/3464304/
MEVFVRFNAKTVPVRVDINSTVQHIRSEVSKENNVNSTDIRIIFAGKELHDYQRLSVGYQEECGRIPITDLHHFAIMGPENYERYKQFGAEECLLKMGGMLCPAPGCGSGIFLEEGGVEERDVMCSECKFHFCIVCREPYHGDEQCASMISTAESLPGSSLASRFAVNLSLSRYDSETASVLQKTTKPCPMCGTPVEKNGGCMHMECPIARCKFSWCWICGAAWDIDCQDNHWFGISAVFELTSLPCSEALLVFPCASSHVMCLDCFYNYCISRLNSRQFVEHDSIGYTLYCPGLNCPGYQEECGRIPITDLHHFAIMGPENYERYKQFGAEECLLKMGGMLCPAPGCGSGIFLEEGGVEERDVMCSECKFHFCIVCREPYHGDEQCASMISTAESLPGSSLASRFAVNLSLSRYDSETASVLQKTTKPCPMCGTPVEKNGGCMHMECPIARCKFSWCWICGAAWDIDCQDNHWFG